MIFETMGVEVHYEIYGQMTEKPAVLCLHGWGCTMEHFRPIIDDLMKDRQVIAVDLPAHGSSSEPPEPWGVPEYTEAVKRLLEHCEIKRCDIIAHSFGGRISLWLSSHSPERVNRMVLTGCAGLKAEPTEEQKKKSADYQKKKKIAQAITKLPLLSNQGEKMLEKLRKKYGSADYNALSPEMRKTFVKIISQDLRPCLKDIKASTLLVFGENDTATPLWMGQTMEKEISDAGLVVFEGDDHFAYLRQWPRFLNITRTFLK